MNKNNSGEYSLPPLTSTRSLKRAPRHPIGYCNTLMNSHGSWTGTDDVKTKAQKARRSRLVGSGGYKEVMEAVKPMVAKGLRDSGDYIGRAVAGHLGIPPASLGKIGRKAGAKISRLIGSGPYGLDLSDYAIHGDVTNDRIFSPTTAYATFKSRGLDCAIIQAREYVSDIYTSTVAGAAVFNNFDINPGIARTFNRLSSIAQDYESYSISGMVFEFVSSASPYISNTALGTAGMTWRRNMYAPAFTGKQSFENTEGALSFRIDHNGLYGIEAETAQTEKVLKYIRSGDPGASGPPLADTDHGKFTFAIFPSSSVPTSTTIGELWVTYNICLMGPQAPLLSQGLWTAKSSTSVGGGTPFGTAGSQTTISTGLDCTITGTVLTLPTDRIGMWYRITVVWVGGSAATTVATPVFANCVDSGEAKISPTAGTATASAQVDYLVQVTAGYPLVPTFTLSGGTYPTSGTVYVAVSAIGAGVPSASLPNV